MADLLRGHINDPQVAEKWSPDKRFFFFFGSEFGDGIQLLFGAELDLLCEIDDCWPPQKLFAFTPLTVTNNTQLLSSACFKKLTNFNMALSSFHFSVWGTQTTEVWTPIF